jgi:hypothetical protein
MMWGRSNLNAATQSRIQDRDAPAQLHPLRCRCGLLKGVLANPRSANRVICYCRDCQAFAHVLGDPARTLDQRGGSDIIQVLPKYLTFTHGAEALACLRLTPKGLLRWYASCCRTPIGNTLASAKLSFIGLVHDCLDASGMSLDDAFGPVMAWVYTKGARGTPKPRNAGQGKVTAWFIRTTLRARLNGDYKLSPFFDGKTGAPIVVPQILTEHDLLRAREAVQAASVE